MRKFALAAFVAMQIPFVRAQAPPHLSPVDVQRATGQTVQIVMSPPPTSYTPGLVSEARDDEELGVIVRVFGTSDNQPLLAEAIGTDLQYARARGNRSQFQTDVKGIGDGAFAGPANETPRILYFRKGKQAASLTAALQNGTPRLMLAQLEALAKILAERMR